MAMSPQAQRLAAAQDDALLAGVPIDANSPVSKILILTFIRQLVTVIGMLIGVFAFAESSWIVRLYRFTQSEQGVAAMIALAGVATTAWQLVRTYLRDRDRKVMASLLPDAVALAPAVPSTSVASAVDAAKALIDTQSLQPNRVSGL